MPETKNWPGEPQVGKYLGSFRVHARAKVYTTTNTSSPVLFNLEPSVRVDLRSAVSPWLEWLEVSLVGDKRGWVLRGINGLWLDKFRLVEKATIYKSPSVVSTILRDVEPGYVDLGLVVNTANGEWREIALTSGRFGFIKGETKGVLLARSRTVQECSLYEAAKENAPVVGKILSGAIFHVEQAFELDDTRWIAAVANFPSQSGYILGSSLVDSLESTPLSQTNRPSRPQSFGPTASAPHTALSLPKYQVTGLSREADSATKRLRDPVGDLDTLRSMLTQLQGGEYDEGEFRSMVAVICGIITRALKELPEADLQTIKNLRDLEAAYGLRYEFETGQRTGEHWQRQAVDFSELRRIADHELQRRAANPPAPFLSR